MDNVEILEHFLKCCKDKTDILYKLDEETKRAIENLIQENKEFKKLFKKLETQMNRDDLSYIETQFVLDILYGKY